MCSLLEGRNHCAVKQLYFCQMKGTSGKHKHSQKQLPEFLQQTLLMTLVYLKRDSPSHQAELLLGFLGWCDRKLSFFLGIWINLNNRHFVKKQRVHFMVCSLFKLNLPLEKKPRSERLNTRKHILTLRVTKNSHRLCLKLVDTSTFYRTAVHLCSTFLHLLPLHFICSDGSLRKNCHLSLDKAL